MSKANEHTINKAPLGSAQYQSEEEDLGHVGILSAVQDLPILRFMASWVFALD
jgi:hypothetical protein